MKFTLRRETSSVLSGSYESDAADAIITRSPIISAETQKIVVGIVFVLVYVYLATSRKHRAIATWVGVGVLLILGILNLNDLVHIINWNVIGVFAGTLVLAEVFIYSKVPLLLADHMVNRTKTVGGAVLMVCMMSGFVSIFTENVAAVLIIAPIAVALARKLDMSPAPFLIGIAISSNLQGAGTLIGDPPSMILAGYERMSFNDFFYYRGKPGMFWVVQVGAIFSFLVLFLIFRKHKAPSGKLIPEKPDSWVPTWALVGMIIALALSPIWDPDFIFLAGLICVMFAVGIMLWHYTDDANNARRIMKSFDWDTTFFLMGVFSLVGALEHTNLIVALRDLIAGITGKSVFANLSFVVWVSVGFSAFIDNVPYITAMIPVVHELGASLGANPDLPYLMVFGLLIGASLGGNITPIGAAANIVSIGILKKEGYNISFWEFMKIGLPFTLAATISGYLFLWIVWR